MSRAKPPPERILDLLPEPIIDLARELQAAEEGSTDHDKLTEVFRGTARRANSVLYRMSVNRIGAQVPASAFDGEADDIEAPGYEPVDLVIGLQAKKNPAE